MYSRMKLESAETSDSQTDSDGDSGDGDESEAELEAPDKSPRQHGLKKPHSAADSKNSKLLVEYDTTDSEADPKGTSRDRDSPVVCAWANAGCYFLYYANACFIPRSTLPLPWQGNANSLEWFEAKALVQNVAAPLPLPSGYSHNRKQWQPPA
jgi:hypothetical protein